jgi:hypothetical protein
VIRCQLEHSIFLITAVVDTSESTLRQRLREWCYNNRGQRGTHRQAVEVSTCFAPRLAWVLAWWASAERRLALVLDASTLSDRFTVLAISVVYRGCAIPVAWQVVRPQTKGAWTPYWKALLAPFAGRVPEDWLVVVLADRGVSARWLYEAIQQCGWHPDLARQRWWHVSASERRRSAPLSQRGAGGGRALVWGSGLLSGTSQSARLYFGRLLGARPSRSLASLD